MAGATKCDQGFKNFRNVRGFGAEKLFGEFGRRGGSANGVQGGFHGSHPVGQGFRPGNFPALRLAGLGLPGFALPSGKTSSSCLARPDFEAGI